MAKEKWYKDGLRFECQGSGKCCSSRGEWGYVYMTLEDRRRMAKCLGLSTPTFTRRYCNRSGDFYSLKENPDSSADCLFLKLNKCSVYEGRPTQCRTWPFWPETMKAKAWRKDVVDFCPGAGKGKLHTQKEIDKILKQQIDSDK